MYEQDGAVWFRSTDFGDDKDRVIFRSNGEPTYFAADIGYVTEKFSRGFDHLIYVWGADHHGTVARVRNAAEAMGYDAGCGPGPALLVGPLRARRRGSVDEQARPASSSRSTSCWPRSASTRRAGSSRHGRRRPASTSTSSWRRSSRPRTPSTTSSTRTPGSRRSCARRPGPGSRRRPRSRDRSRARPRRHWRERSPASRRSSRTPSGPRRRRGSPPTRPSWRRPSTASTATHGSSTPTNRSARRHAWLSPTPRGSRCRTR